MQTLKISEAAAFNLYPTAAPEFKTMLEESFGKDFFSRKITDRVKTFDDACQALGKNVEEEVRAMIGLSIDESAYRKLKIIVEALNEGWKPDWTNGKWDKYYPWFNLSSGSGLRFFGYVDRASGSVVGSRLCYKSSELATYAGTQFIDIYSDFFTK